MNFKMKIGLLSVSTFFCFAPPVFITNKLMYWLRLVDQAFHDNALYMFYCTFTKGEPFSGKQQKNIVVCDGKQLIEPNIFFRVNKR